MAPEYCCQTTPMNSWCPYISGAQTPFADVTPLLEFGTTTPCANSLLAPKVWHQTPKVVPRQQNGVWHQKCHGTRIQWEWFGTRILVP
ncbi:hypothetical protein Tco_0392852 [Tanacetum coccineum]